MKIRWVVKPSHDFLARNENKTSQGICGIEYTPLLTSNLLTPRSPVSTLSDMSSVPKPSNMYSHQKNYTVWLLIYAKTYSYWKALRSRNRGPFYHLLAEYGECEGVALPPILGSSRPARLAGPHYILYFLWDFKKAEGIIILLRTRSQIKAILGQKQASEAFKSFRASLSHERTTQHHLYGAPPRQNQPAQLSPPYREGKRAELKTNYPKHGQDPRIIFSPRVAGASQNFSFSQSMESASFDQCVSQNPYVNDSIRYVYQWGTSLYYKYGAQYQDIAHPNIGPTYLHLDLSQRFQKVHIGVRKITVSRNFFTS